MANHIKTRQTDETWVVRAAGAVIAESQNAVELTEGDYPAVIYFPREDIAMAFLDESDHSTHCPHKGEARYFTIQAKSGPIPNAGWSYEAPLPGVEQIKDHIAFYTDKVTVEAL